ncbi:FxSxx-COOH system tetratricopeptide repeat protein [Streptomyces angustmyceticus]|uniref:ATP-binding protein n=1 Tax=Streptomyces angustmyceticus TaxID=285578 RepID=A0A5J4LFW8_9ACTN|nr:FxSxx-COOH system tetratricopeptide repeat protein [Streptomyces angustmyceticus]UAL67134.1 tetratricopeptide repeat protein [Streptomyces angustmyceticus]GES30579.1 ATP-binding protein [Streptomyces angustmyceticus]
MVDQATFSGPTGSGEHITISYAGFTRPWAAWISHQLEAQGHGTTLLRWDPQVDTALVEELSGLLEAEGRLLIVLDDWYFRLGPKTQEEWTAALREVVSPHADRFAAVSVATQSLPATASLLRPADLRDLDAQEANRRVLQRLGIAGAGRAVDEEAPGAPRFPNNPPEVWNIPRRNNRFTGRDGVLEELHGKLAGSGAGAGPPLETRIALYGTSGVGKSQIAAEYAHRFGNDYDVVWWISATNRGAAREQLAELATRLGLPVGRELGDRIRAVHEALRVGRPYRRWLLVFDSADDMEQIEDLVPDGRGHVLITTLTRDWSGSGSAQEIEVLPFDRVESVAYARRRAPRLTPMEADLLSDAVQDLPLLLAQTAAWLDANPMSPKEYIELIRRGEPSLVGIRISSDYPMAFQTSWAITLNTLRERSPAAVELLKLFAFFAPDAIPVPMLAQARRGDLPEHLADLAAEPISWNTALRRLTESTAVRLDYQASQDAEPAVETALMHRLYHRFLRSDMTEDERDLMAATACRVLVTADPQDPADTRYWERYAALIPHLEPAGVLDSPEPAVQQLLLNCVEYLRVRGEYRMGLRLCEQFMSRWRTRLAATQRTMLVLTHQHANMLRRLGRYREAEAVGSAVVDQLTAERDPADADLLRAQDGLAGTLIALGAYGQAYDLFDAVWRTYAALLGPEAPRTLSSRHNLATVLALLGRYDEALVTHREVLAFRERELRARHHLTLNAGTAYARTLRLLGRYRDATSGQELNARLHLQVMGAHTPQTLRAEHNLALCLRRSGDTARAAALLADLVERSRRVQGPRHPETLMVRADHATFLREHGDLGHARDLAEEVAERYRALAGERHPYTVGTLGNVGLVRAEFGDSAEALALADRALGGMTEAMGPDHPWTLGCALNAGAARNRVDDEEGAVELGRATLARAKAALGDTHPLTLSAKTALAEDLRALRRGQEAAKLEQEAIGQLSETLGPEHPHTLSARRRRRPYWDFEPQPV